MELETTVNKGDEMRGKLFGVGCLFCWFTVGTMAVSPSGVVAGSMAGKNSAETLVLIQELRNPKMGTRWNAALLLGDIGGDAAVTALIECVAKDDNARVRRRAIEALVKLGVTAAVPTLTAARRDPDRFVRRDVARALGALGDKKSVPPLLELLKDKEGFVRRDAARALGDIGASSTIPVLLSATKESAKAYSADAPLMPEEMSPVAREAFFALGKFGGETSLPALAKVLKHSTTEVRVRAVTALGHAGAEAAPLLTTATADDTRVVRLAAIAGLKSVGGPAGVAGLAEALKYDDEATQREAVRALGELGAESALPVLRKKLAAGLKKKTKSRLPGIIKATIKAIEKHKE